MTVIKLTGAEMQMAALVGTQRQLESLKLGHKHMYGAKNEDSWQMNIEGALGECALAKHLGVYWSKGAVGAPDVGEVDVRTTTHQDGRLILHDRDHDNRKYYLLTGINGEYVIRGWMWGKDGKNAKYKQDPQGTNRWAYFVPQADLQDSLVPEKEKDWLDD